MVKEAKKVHELLKQEGISSTVINARFAMPFDKEQIDGLEKNHQLLVTLEENVYSGGFGEHVSSYVKENELDLDVMSVAIMDEYVEQGNVEILKKKLGLDAESIVKRIKKKMNGK